MHVDTASEVDSALVINAWRRVGDVLGERYVPPAERTGSSRA